MRDQFQQFTKTAVDNYTDANDRMVEVVVDANRKAVEIAVRAADQFIEQLEQIENLPQMPFADKVPTPSEAGARYLEWVDRAAELNREFAQRVAASVQGEVTVEPAPAEKSTAKKSTAKKSTAKKSTTKKAAASK
jgi:hypothetical protein